MPYDQQGMYPAVHGLVPVTLGRRVAARLIDVVLQLALAGFTIAIVGTSSSSQSATFSLGVLGFQYFIYPLGVLLAILTQGGSPGHLLAGIKHVSVTTGRIAGGATFVKYLIEGLLVSFTLGIGLLVAIFTIKEPLNRNAFDRLAGTMPVDVRASMAAGTWSRRGAIPVGVAATAGPATAGPSTAEHSLADDIFLPPQAASPLFLPPQASTRPVQPGLAVAPGWAEPSPRPAEATMLAGLSHVEPVRALPPLSPLPVHGVTLRLDSGEILVLDGPIILGRAPSVRPGLEGAQLVSVADEQMSLSKTHVAVGPAEGGVWIIDLNSTNGVRRVSTSGAPEPLPKGLRYEAPIGSVIEFGLRTFEVMSS